MGGPVDGEPRELEWAAPGGNRLPPESKPERRGRGAGMDQAGLLEYAVRALGRRMRTEAELRRLLEARAQPGEPGRSAVESVLVGLKDRRYLDDSSYAETFARLRKENEKFGPRRVRQTLRQKGVSAGIADSAVDAAYAAVSQESLARRHLERKRIPKPANEKDTARVMRRLLAAGFSTSVIYRVLRQWEVPDESLAPLDQLDDDVPEA